MFGDVRYVRQKFVLSCICHECDGGGPGAVVKAVCLDCSNSALALKFQRHEMFLPFSPMKIQYCGEPL